MTKENQRNDQNPSAETSPVDRRRFVKTVLASVSAAGLACAMPKRIDAATGKPVEFVCVIEWLFQMGAAHFYLAMNCTTDETFIFADVAGLPLGDCADPVGTGCVEATAFYDYVRTDDQLKIVLSPRLDEQQKKQVDLFRSLMLMNS